MLILWFFQTDIKVWSELMFVIGFLLLSFPVVLLTTSFIGLKAGPYCFSG